MSSFDVLWKMAKFFDNNAVEQIIRPFCIGEKNWVMIDIVFGEESSVIIYSIAEIAKTNNLKPHKNFEYLLTEIAKHMDDHDMSFCEYLCHGQICYQRRVESNFYNQAVL